MPRGWLFGGNQPKQSGWTNTGRDPRTGGPFARYVPGGLTPEDLLKKKMMAEAPVQTAVTPTPPPSVNTATAGQVNTGVPPFYTEPWVPPPSVPQPDLPGGQGGTGFTWPYADDEFWRNYHNDRIPTLPGWAEALGYQAGQNIGGMFGTSPTTPQEQFALQEIAQLMTQPQGPGAEESAAAGSMMGALGPQEPGGRAFQNITSALEPAWRRQQDELYDIYRSDMAKKGLTYSGRYGQGLEGLMGRAGESYAATMAPYALEGERLAQDERMGAQTGLMNYGQQQWQRPLTQAGFTVPSLMNYGAGQYNRMWDPYEQLYRLMGGLGGSPAAPEEASPGFWDYAVQLGSALIPKLNF